MSDRPEHARRARTPSPSAGTHWLHVLTLLPLLAACSTFTEEAHRRIAYSMDCPKPQVTITEVSERTYVARGCGYKGTYVCRHKRHPHAGGARYVACELQRGANR